MCAYDKLLEEYGAEEVAKRLFNSAYVMKKTSKDAMYDIDWVAVCKRMKPIFEMYKMEEAK